MGAIIDFPDVFPTEAVTETLRILRGKTIETEKRLLVRCAVTLQAWAFGKIFTGPAIFTETPAAPAMLTDLIGHLDALAAADADLKQGFNPIMILQIAAAIIDLIDFFRKK